jgi:aminoglycoside 3-N-acetyltransferase
MITRNRLAEDLEKLGLRPGDTVYAHTSLKSIGWIDGGPEALIGAFLDVMGDRGTLCVPTHTLCFAGYTQEIYSAETTPTVLGAFPEAVRRHPRALRSGHASHSSAAIGWRAAAIVENHDPSHALGYDSPLHRIYRLGGRVLLIGVGHGANTSIHLAESMAGVGYTQLHYCADWGSETRAAGPGGAVLRFAQREYPGCSGSFPMLDGLFKERGISDSGQIGNAPSQLLDMAAMVDITVDLLRRDPGMLLCANESCPCCPARRAYLLGRRGGA